MHCNWSSEDLVQLKKKKRKKEKKKIHPIAERKAVIRINTPLIECY